MRNPFLQEEKQIMRRDRRSDADYQQEVGKLVEREVIYGVSSLVHEIARKNDDWFHLFVQEDWETPAREGIPLLPPEKLLKFLERNSWWISTDEATPEFCLTLLETDGSWQNLCAAHDLEPHRHEIYEHWIVSDWLASKLEQRGEVIERDFYGLTIWGRACTGQAILLDDVICSIYDELHPEQEANRIAELNDRFRSRCGIPVFGEHVPGGFVFTQGINSLPPETQISIWAAVRDFNDFSEGNDPHAERDFGAFTIDDVPEKIFWKISYYADASCSGGAEDPADTTKCFRILTVMLASEY
jgi:hypothetical protein